MGEITSDTGWQKKDVASCCMEKTMGVEREIRAVWKDQRIEIGVSVTPSTVVSGDDPRAWGYDINVDIDTLQGDSYSVDFGRTKGVHRTRGPPTSTMKHANTTMENIMRLIKEDGDLETYLTERSNV